MHYYQHHIGDFIRDTSNLTDSQCMAYLRLIWMYYDNEAPLPNKPKILAFKIGSTEETVSLILEAFFTPEGDAWRHSRCESEIAGYNSLRERNATNGKSGGRPKKTQTKPSGFPVATQTEPHRNPNQEPVTSNQENTALLCADAREAAAESDPPADTIPPVEPDPPDPALTRKAELTIQLRQQGIDVNMSNPHLLAWVDADVTDDEMLVAVTRARERKPKPARINAGYLNCIVGDILDDRAKKYPAGASTPPGPLSSTKPNRGNHHGKSTGQLQRTDITNGLASIIATQHLPLLSDEDFRRAAEHSGAVCADGGLLRQSLDIPVPVG